MNKKIVSIVAAIIILIIIGVYIKAKKIPVVQNDESVNQATSTEIITPSTPEITTPNKTFLQTTPYVDQSANFSLVLPRGWVLQDKANSTTTSNTWFAGASSTIVVSRYARTSEIESTIEKLGPGGLIDVVVNNIASGLNTYSLVSTKSVMINGTSYREVISTYIGTKTKKQVTQYLYVTIAKNAYYVIGIDVYSDLLNKNKDAIIQSIGTLKLLQ